MRKYNPVRLVFNDSYGSVRWSEDFKHSDQLHKLDVLKDWVRIYNMNIQVFGMKDGVKKQKERK